MIKFLAHAGDGHLVGLGLSDENVRRLKLGQPIVVHLQGMVPGLDRALDVMIFTGADEAAMAATLSDLIGPDTKISPMDDEHLRR